MAISTEKEILLTEVIHLSESVLNNAVSSKRDYKQEDILKIMLKNIISSRNEHLFNKLKKINSNLKKNIQFVIDDFVKEVIQIKTKDGIVKVLFCIPVIYLGLRENSSKYSGVSGENFDDELGDAKEAIEGIFKRMLGNIAEINVLNKLIDHESFIGTRKRVLDLLNGDLNEDDSILKSKLEPQDYNSEEDMEYKIDCLKYFVGTISVPIEFSNQQHILEKINDFNDYSKEFLEVCDEILQKQKLRSDSTIILPPSLLTTGLENGSRRYNYEGNFIYISSIKNEYPDPNDLVGKVHIDSTQGLIDISICSKKNNKEIYGYSIDYIIRSYEYEIIDLKEIFDSLKIECEFKIKGAD